MTNQQTPPTFTVGFGPISTAVRSKKNPYRDKTDESVQFAASAGNVQAMAEATRRAKIESIFNSKEVS